MGVLRKPCSRWIAAVVLGLTVLAVGPARAQVDENPPFVIGFSIADAEATLREWEFDVEIRFLEAVPDGVDPADVVVAQQSLVNPGWSIEQIPPIVELTLGVPMPYLEGLTWADARTLLEESGLVPSPLLEDASGDLVVTLAPTAWLPVPFGSEVSVKLEPAATDPEATREIDVPTTVGPDTDRTGGPPDEEQPRELDQPGDERSTPATPSRDEPTLETDERPAAGADERGLIDRRLLVTTVIVLTGVLLVLTTGAIHRVRRRRRDRRDRDWIDAHLRAAPRPDPEPALTAHDRPGTPHREVGFVGERGPAPTITEEVSKR